MSAFSRARQWARDALTIRTGIGLVILVVLVLVAVFAPLVARFDPIDRSGYGILRPPSLEAWLGTDDLGRDTFARIVFGARTSLLAGLLAVSVGVVLGTPIGLIAGYRGGWVETVLMRATDALLAFPGLVLAIGITAALGPSITNAMIAVGILFAPAIARLMRGQVLTIRESLYVDVARSYGASSKRIIVRHVLPNAVQPILVQASTMFGLALLSEAGLSYLGLGVQPPEPSWGGMLARAYPFMRNAAWQVIFPGVAIVLAVFSFNAVGDLIQDSLDPTRRRSGGSRRSASDPAVLEEAAISDASVSPLPEPAAF
jgi:peptide/nickel transport system permease protein